MLTPAMISSTWRHLVPFSAFFQSKHCLTQTQLEPKRRFFE
jgi:hypothetical protein